MLLKWLPINTIAPTGYRIARFLLTQLPEKYRTHEVVTMTQSEIAQQLSCSRATVAKGVSFLYDKGIVCTGHGKIIVDTGKLKVYIRGK